MLEFAKNTALEAGEVLKHYYNAELSINTKSTDRDLVTQADIESEKLVVDAIQQQFPAHAILAEEQGEIGNSEYLWLIDPLDGTTNFAHKHPIFCVVIALAYKREMALAVIYDPLRNEMFTAEKNKGAYLNEKKIRVSENKVLSTSIIATGFPYDRETNPLNNLSEFGKMMPRVQGIRRCGSAALDMCYVACGRIDGYWEYHLNPWDFAGGVLLVQEAEGKISNIDGCDWSLDSNTVIAANPNIHEKILTVLH